MTQLPEIFNQSIAEGSCLLLVLGGKRAGSDEASERFTLRPVRLRGEEGYQLASNTNGREVHENLSADEAGRRVGELFGPVFEHCHLFTPKADFEARLKADGTVRVTQGPPTRTVLPKSHNRSKNYIIPENVPCPFLVEIGVMTPAGMVRASKYQKFRQINRFLELVEDVVEFLPCDGELSVFDYGCGKSYLTFALYHLLTVVHHREVKMTGLDREQTVVAMCADVAKRLGYQSLEFQCGEIADFDAGRKVDLAVSLHACDTATDDALAHAVRRNADVILAVPCCQHELAGQIHSEPLRVLERHGILKERLAALATDSLRASALEICGYRTQVVEFIDMEHTAKNLLIRAVLRESAPRADDEVAAYRDFKTFLGLKRLHLEERLGVEFQERIED
ncbi:MAG: SAM-dependent methyltransferase [Planctomycetaceae bacterium]